MDFMPTGGIIGKAHQVRIVTIKQSPQLLMEIMVLLIPVALIPVAIVVKRWLHLIPDTYTHFGDFDGINIG